MKAKDVPATIIDYSGIPEPFPHPLASAWGEDDSGWWMSIDILGVEQVFRWIFPGIYWMGSPEDEPERFEYEALHEVTLSKGFWLADTVCTQELWQAVMGDNPARFQESPQHPVDNVRWEDVNQRFLPALEKKAGLLARLPTEAEWEYACRAGTRTPFNLGENITTNQVNFNGNYPYNDAEKSEYRERTVAVKSLNALNAWGLHEMHGNVYEWCQDWYGDYPQDPAVDPAGPESGSSRVVRGGSWIHYGRNVRSAFRNYDSPGNRSSRIGFRLALGQSVAEHSEPVKPRS